MCPDRIRRIAGQGFGFLPHRFLRDGFLSALTPDEVLLYVFLVLVANRHGVSFYGYDAICTILRLPLERYIDARNRLIDLDLLVFDGARFQLLSLPDEPPPLPPPESLANEDDFELRDPATIRVLVRKSLDLDPDR